MIDNQYTFNIQFIYRKNIRWDSEKEKQLKFKRDLCFETISTFMLQNPSCILDIINHPNDKKYPNQQIIVINLKNYAYIIPYVETSTEIFLKTIIPSRKMTKKYLS